jgi:PAS domain S-box-containing protein
MIRALYVDDEPGLLEIGKLFLELGGQFSVDIITSAPSALNLMNTENYDAIISDYQMPEMDGIKFLKEVRSTYGEVPFILFTGKGREEIVIQAIDNGVDFYVQKGGEPKSQFADLAQKIKIAVERRQAIDLVRDSEQCLADLINFLPDATFAIDTEGKVIIWNKAIEDLTGVSASEILGKRNYEYALCFYGTRRPLLIDMIFESDEAIIRHYYPLIKKEGTILITETPAPYLQGASRVLMAKASLFYNKKGDVVGAIESIRDITGLIKTDGETRAMFEMQTPMEEESRQNYENHSKKSQNCVQAGDRTDLMANGTATTGNTNW